MSDVTLNLAQTSVMKNRPSVPYSYWANLFHKGLPKFNHNP